jgi:hypothetical protein
MQSLPYWMPGPAMDDMRGFHDTATSIADHLKRVTTGDSLGRTCQAGQQSRSGSIGVVDRVSIALPSLT